MTCKKCWVCLAPKKQEGPKGACLTCYNRNWKRFGKQWESICRVAIDAGNRHLLLPQTIGRRLHVQRFLEGPVKAPPAPVQRVYDDSAVPTGPAGVALLEARKNPARSVIPVPLGPAHTTSDILYFTPYLDSKGRIQVRPVTQ